MSWNRRSKYHAQKIKVGNEWFDSKKEAHRWQELKLLERAGQIEDLERQKRYVLLPAQRDKETGALLERAVTYIADFVYLENERTVVEDTKGFRTDAYIIKRKLMLHVYGIRIRET